MKDEALAIGYHTKNKMVVFSAFKDTQETRIELSKLTACRLGLTLVFMSIVGIFYDLFGKKEEK